MSVETALKAAQPSGDILEIACGKGLWTQHLLPGANSLTAIDASPEAMGKARSTTIAINQQRLKSAGVEYLIADIFSWQPTKQFDFIFFGFWLFLLPTPFSHLLLSTSLPFSKFPSFCVDICEVNLGILDNTSD